MSAENLFGRTEIKSEGIFISNRAGKKSIKFWNHVGEGLPKGKLGGNKRCQVGKNFFTQAGKIR